ncbi:MAG TPA: c-type cytochrome domain-containing protein [Kofleriaceae bacterium]|nr:c-type cytochrome domain-containing protein [Kofleriaceae bacterium]
MRLAGLPILLAGCLPGPDVGQPLHAADGSVVLGDAPPGCNADSEPSRSVSFSADLVGGVFVRGKCVTCHTGGGQGVQQSGFNMSSYTQLRAGGQHSGTSIVVAGEPCSSIIVLKIDATPPFGRRMPYNGPPYLATSDIQLVRDWIAEGAHDN